LTSSWGFINWLVCHESEDGMEIWSFWSDGSPQQKGALPPNARAVAIVVSHSRRAEALANTVSQVFILLAPLQDGFGNLLDGGSAHFGMVKWTIWHGQRPCECRTVRHRGPSASLSVYLFLTRPHSGGAYAAFREPLNVFGRLLGTDSAPGHDDANRIAE
jgi:hypothetical protein